MPCHVLFPLCGCKTDPALAPTSSDVRVIIPSRVHTEDLTKSILNGSWTPEPADSVSFAHVVVPAAPVEEAPVDETPSSPEPAEGEAEEKPVDPEAPYGRKKDGTPRKPPGRPKTPWAVREREPVPGEKKPEPTEIELYITALLQTPEGIEALQKQLDADLARASFPEFFRQAWKVIEPNTELIWNWHLSLMCSVVQAVFMDWLKAKQNRKYLNKIRNILFNVPPGSSKSRVLAVAFQAWAWLHCPGMKFICLSVNDDATMRDARAARDLIRSPWYVSTFGIEWNIKSDQDAISNYGNTAGGERISMASKSEIVGLRADCVAGDTRVATAEGDIAISELHGMAERGEPLPQVWSVNHATGEPELRTVVATRNRKTTGGVLIRTEFGNAFYCTPDHRVWTETASGNEGGDYTQAAHLTGRRVSVLRRANVSVADREATALRELSVRDVDVCTVLDDVSASRRGVRQTRASRSEGRTVLQQALQNGVESAAGQDSTVPGLWRCVPAERQGARDVFEEVSGSTPLGHAQYVAGTRVHALRDALCSDVVAHNVLQQDVRGRSAFGSYDGFGKPELLGSRRPAVLGRTLAEFGAADSRAGRVSMYRVRFDGEQARDARPPHQPQSDEQRARESDHALRPLSHDAPQITRAAVLSVDETSPRGRGETYDVYDIQVEENHNFFANGVLVHNCILIDDPNNPKKAENKNERDEINELWSTNQYNRVNDGMRSLRIGVQQRTHAADWTGNVISLQGTWTPPCGDPKCDKKKGCCNRDGWLQVVIPAEFESARKFVMPDVLVQILREQGLPEFDIVTEDPRKIEGESIDPVRMPLEYLAGERKRWEGTGSYAGQMQQSPVASEGNKVDRKWWNFFRLAKGVREDIDEIENGRPRPVGCHPGEAQIVHAKHYSPGNWEFDWITISIDCASKKTEKGSNYGILVIGGKGGRRYVLDDATQRGALHEIIEVLVGSDDNPERPRSSGLVQKWRPDSILIEPKAAGPDVMDTLIEQMGRGDVPMVSIWECEPGNADKELRLEAAIPYIKNGMVYLLDGAPWLEEFVKELSIFPNGLRDDRVDALSQCLNFKRAADDEWPDL